jgi:very-short-patch-repair endonuclease
MLPADEMTIRRGIPVTTTSRTLLDLAAAVPVEALAYALREAEVRRLDLRPSFDVLLARHRGHRGTAALRRCLRRLGHLPATHGHNRLEIRFQALIARSDLPRPQTNVQIDLGDRTTEADCLWREQRLIVELDGHEVHGTRAAFEGDRERDRRLQAAGWTVVRVTWRQLEDEPEAVLADLRGLLS